MYLGKRKSFLIGGSVLLVAALAVAAATRAHLNAKRTAEANAAAMQPTPLVVPADTPIHVTLDQSLASNQSRPGEHFEATISQPIVIDGTTVVPQGAHAEGVVVDARPSGRLKGVARLQISLVSVDAESGRYDIRTKSSTRVGRNHNKHNLGWIGGGAGGGALIGAVAGGGEGALIGGPVGAGAGVTVAYLTGRRNVRLPAETRLTFRLGEPVSIVPPVGTPPQQGT